jgi:hypothetical protein
MSGRSGAEASASARDRPAARRTATKSSPAGPAAACHLSSRAACSCSLHRDKPQARGARSGNAHAQPHVHLGPVSGSRQRSRSSQRRMVTRPGSTASAGPVIEVMALLLLCRGPGSNPRSRIGAHRITLAGSEAWSAWSSEGCGDRVSRGRWTRLSTCPGRRVTSDREV